MNDAFSLRRFTLLFKKTLFERPAQMFGLTVLSLAGVLIIYAILKTLAGFEEAQTISFLLGFIGGGTVLASNVFGYFSSSASGSSFLTLPASHFEKWLVGVLITGVLFTGVFLSVYHIIDLTFVHLYRTALDHSAPFYQQMYDEVQPFRLNQFVALKSYTFFANFSGAMLVGSLYFNKVSFIKVALLIVVLMLGGYFINYLMACLLFGNATKAIPYYCVFVSVGKDYGKVELPVAVAKAADICMQYVFPAILYFAAFTRLREKEF